MRQKKGFTIVELLVVVAIIGIIAAIAIPQFNKHKNRTYLAILDSDLKNAFTAAQAYITDFSTATITDAAVLRNRGFKNSPGIRVVSIDISSKAGSIVLSHSNLTPGIADSNQGSIDYNGTITTPQLK